MKFGLPSQGAEGGGNETGLALADSGQEVHVVAVEGAAERGGEGVEVDHGHGVVVHYFEGGNVVGGEVALKAVEVGA